MTLKTCIPYCFRGLVWISEIVYLDFWCIWYNHYYERIFCSFIITNNEPYHKWPKRTQNMLILVSLTHHTLKSNRYEDVYRYCKSGIKIADKNPQINSENNKVNNYRHLLHTQQSPWKTRNLNWHQRKLNCRILQR